MTGTLTPLQGRKSMEPWLYDSIEFYDYQIAGIRTMARMPNFMLCDQMGLGKSLQALTVFTIDVVRGLAEKMLIVCPVSLRGNWADEISTFTTFQYMLFGQTPHPSKPGKFKTLTKQEREFQFLEFVGMPGPKILIVNYEQVVAHAALFKNYFDMLVCDEAHYIKSPTSRRSKAVHHIRARRNAMLTGTPQLNQVDELWSLLHMMDPRRFYSYRKFVNRYCVFGGYGGKQIVGAKNVKELNDILAEYMVRRLKADVLPLPEPRYITVGVDLHPEQRKLYDQLMDDLILPDANGNPQEIDNALVKFMRAKQICASTGTMPGMQDFSYKLDVAVERIKEVLDRGEKVVVFTQFRPILDFLAERLHRIVNIPLIPTLSGSVPPPMRQGVVKEWANDPRPLPLLCMLQVAGVGLNMTAARTVIRVDKLFVPGLNDQAVDRVHRIGQSETQPIDVIDLIARGTIESRIEVILRTKRRIFKEVVEETTAFQKILAALRQGNP